MSDGPVPKRSDQRRRRNKPDVPLTTARAHGSVMPPPEEHWHNMARDWYMSLGESGQSVFYEGSDWQVARVWAEVLSQQLGSGKLSALMIAAWNTSANELLTTEGARRRARVELTKGDQVDTDEVAAVEQMAAYRDRLGS